MSKKKPEPVPGLVIKFDYLWKDEQLAGQWEGAKERPCAIVTAVAKEETGGVTVFLTPVTHTAPHNQNDAVQIPTAIARHIGLDDEQSWIRTTEYNIVDWDDPGIVPASKTKWEFGRLPHGVYTGMKASIEANIRRREARSVDRRD